MWGGVIALSVVLGHMAVRRLEARCPPVLVGRLNFRREASFILLGALALRVLFAVADIVSKSVDGTSTYVASCQAFHDGNFEGRFNRQAAFLGKDVAKQALVTLAAAVALVGVMSLVPLLDVSRAELIPALRQQGMEGALAAITFMLGVSLTLYGGGGPSTSVARCMRRVLVGTPMVASSWRSAR